MTSEDIKHQLIINQFHTQSTLRGGHVRKVRDVCKNDQFCQYHIRLTKFRLKSHKLVRAAGWQSFGMVRHTIARQFQVSACSQQALCHVYRQKAGTYRRNCCWSRLYSAILCSRADSLRSHVILHEWLASYSAFLNIYRSGVLTALAWNIHRSGVLTELAWNIHRSGVLTELAWNIHRSGVLTALAWNIHRSGVLTALAWLVPRESAAVSARSVYTIQPCSMSLHTKPHK